MRNSKFCGYNIKFEDVKIAYRELLSAVIALLYFAPNYPSSFIRINTDRKNVVAWLNRGRCSKSLGYSLLSVIELLKYKYKLKISAYFFESAKNTSADMLSRGKTPSWLRKRGVRYVVSVKDIDIILSNPIMYWKKILSV